MKIMLGCTVMVALFWSATVRAQWDPWSRVMLGRSSLPTPYVEFVGGLRSGGPPPSFTSPPQMPTIRITLDTNTGFLGCVAFSPDGKTLAAERWDSKTSDAGRLSSTIGLWDVATGRSTAVLHGDAGFVTSMVFSPDGRRLAWTSERETIQVWDAATGKNTANLHLATGFVRSLAFSPDGKTMASAGGDKTIKLWDVAVGKKMADLHAHRETTFSSVLFSPDGKTLASCGIRRINLWDVATISLWDLATGKNTTNFSTHGTQFEFSALAFSPDGTTLASGRGDGAIKLWDVATGMNTATLVGHSFWIRSLVFSPDGRQLASGSEDGTIGLWDVAARKDTANFDAISRHVNSIAFSADGRTLAWASFDNTIKLWDVKTDPKAAKEPPGQQSTPAATPKGK